MEAHFLGQILPEFPGIWTKIPGIWTRIRQEPREICQKSPKIPENSSFHRMQNPIPAASCRSPLKSDALHADPRCNLTCSMPSDVLHADPADDTPRKHGQQPFNKNMHSSLPRASRSASMACASQAAMSSSSITKDTSSLAQPSIDGSLRQGAHPAIFAKGHCDTPT